MKINGIRSIRNICILWNLIQYIFLEQKRRLKEKKIITEDGCKRQLVGRRSRRYTEYCRNDFF